MTVDMSLNHVAGVLHRLEQIEMDLTTRQAVYESAAHAWYIAKRDREHARAVAFMGATGTVAERNAVADRESCMIGKEAEAEYEALKAVVRVMETRASIGQSILRSQREGR